MAVAISRTDLARNTRQIVDQVRHGQPVVVQSYGEDQIVLLDALDYRLMQSVVAYALKPDFHEAENDLSATLRLYLGEQISLAKAAERLGLSRFDLMERFERLGIPLRSGPETLEEARREDVAAQQSKSMTK